MFSNDENGDTQREYSDKSPNAPIITGDIFYEVERLIEGEKVDEKNFFSLCEFIENTLSNKVSYLSNYNWAEAGESNLVGFFTENNIIEDFTYEGFDEFFISFNRNDFVDKIVNVVSEGKIEKPHHLLQTYAKGDKRNIDLQFNEFGLMLLVTEQFQKEIDLDESDYFSSLDGKIYPETVQKILGIMEKSSDDPFAAYFNNELRRLEKWFNSIRAIEDKSGLYVVDDIFKGGLYEKMARPGIKIDERLYGAVSKALKDDLTRIEQYSGKTTTFVPPFTSIILSRSKDRSSIPEQIVKAKVEFAELIELNNKYNVHIADQSKSLKERTELINEYEKMHEQLVKKITSKSREKTLSRLWDIVKSFNLVQISQKLVEELITEGGNIKWRYRVKPYIDLYKKVGEIKEYEALIRNTFNSEIE